MIYELAMIEVKQGLGPEFQAAVQEARALFEKATGFGSMSLLHSIEHPTRYHLLVQWETVENHMVDFRSSHAFGRWRELIGPYLASAPIVEHAYSVFGKAASALLKGALSDDC